MDDIKKAVRLLSEANYGTTSDNKEDIDLSVANMVLARAALCFGDDAAVIAACDYVISNTTLMGESIYYSKPADDGEYYAKDNGFLNVAINPECVLGWTSANFVTYVHTDWFNILGIRHGGGVSGYMRIDDRLYNRINDNDYRKDAFQGPTNFGEWTYPPNNDVRMIPSYANFKFASSWGLGAADRNTPNVTSDIFFRASEAYLMKAEAQMNAGQEDAAKATLNLLLAARTKEGAPKLTCDNYFPSPIPTMDFIRLQTRIEMWGECGLEFFNNKRWNIPVSRESSGNHTSKVSCQVSDMTMQIPDSEILYNPLAVQN
jgi:hypothetical protein